MATSGCCVHEIRILNLESWQAGQPSPPSAWFRVSELRSGFLLVVDSGVLALGRNLISAGAVRWQRVGGKIRRTLTSRRNASVNSPFRPAKAAA